VHTGVKTPALQETHRYFDDRNGLTSAEASPFTKHNPNSTTGQCQPQKPPKPPPPATGFLSRTPITGLHMKIMPPQP